jgi:hypothetical protein
MPPELIVGGAVGVILLVLLGSLLFKGNRKQRRSVGGPSMEELSREMKRVADALEVLVARLDASPASAKQVTGQVAERVVAPPRPVAEAVRHEQRPAAGKIPAPIATPVQTAASEATEETPTVTEAAATAAPTAEAGQVEEPKRRVKLSMFGR